MKRNLVESSNVAEVGYDPVEKVLEVCFHSGAIYQYQDVDETVYRDMMNAPSVGRFLNQVVKPHHMAGFVGFTPEVMLEKYRSALAQLREHCALEMESLGTMAVGGDDFKSGYSEAARDIYQALIGYWLTDNIWPE